MTEVKGQNHLANDNINEIRNLMDLITDEYGNYYHIVTTKTGGGKLHEVTLSHAYYEDSFSILSFAEPLQNELEEKYRNTHVGHRLKDRLNGAIENAKRKERVIFTIQDLINNGTEVSFMNITETHPRGK
ncbi:MULTISPECIES: hypothetical protein [Bacillus cereus group]|uniref:hypothetical protein n=1 Tax=Bacillus TaxID=1386 RepID=UPI0001A1C6CB|nr:MULTISPECIES: hypothetical protein [Bacillus cereus group]EEM68409.1 hypothetical protein bthur0009_55620 [Bacillus thuringiensis serovar andalousiensis BGSC 4AW1]MEB9631742.1 hypothetical protein [Bacillus anthracis]